MIVSTRCAEATARGWVEKHAACVDGAALNCACSCHRSSAAIAAPSATARRQGVEGAAIGADGPRDTAGFGEVACNVGQSARRAPVSPHFGKATAEGRTPRPSH